MFHLMKNSQMKMIEKRRGLVQMLPFAFLLTVLFSVSSCKDDDNPAPVAAPALNAATEITATSFKISWAQVTGAEKYLLDVSTASNFATTVTGYAKKELTGTNATVTGLTAKTKYYYRLYAKKGSTVSVASTVKEATTIE